MLPLRKVSPGRVALTSYYSKLFVERSERKSNNYPNWLINQVRNIGLNVDDKRIVDVKLSNVFYSDLTLPRGYSTLATTFSSFKAGDYQFVLDYKRRPTADDESLRAALESDKGSVCVGSVANTKDYLVMNADSLMLQVNASGKVVKELGTLEDVIGLSNADRPLEYAEIGIMGKSIPLGLVLAKLMGFGTLLATLKVKHRRVKSGESLKLDENEYAIRFADQTIVVERGNAKADMILNGFNRYHRDIKRYGIFQFDKAEVYDVIMERNDLGPRYAREIEMLNQLWVDHITREILTDMKEPTNLIGLLMRSVELLTTDWHPDVMDMNFMRDCGYERMAGNLYTELCKSIRAYKARPLSKQSSVELNPQAVWQQLLQDPAVSLIEQSNPIHNLKEKEVVIFGGIGGRSARTMVAPNRRFHRSNMGVVSEATVDNSDVATTTTLVADPNYLTVRGISRRVEKSDGPAKLVSTSMLLGAGLDRDD